MTTKPAQITENTPIVLPVSTQLKLIGSVAGIVATIVTGAMFYMTALAKEFKEGQELTNKKVNYLEIIVYGKIDADEIRPLRDEDVSGRITRGNQTSNNLKLTK